MRTTAVIVNYNTKEQLARCLMSLADWPNVVVVDNGSDDASASMVAERFPLVKLVSAKQNRGFAAGANAGLAQVETEFALILNPDSWVTPEVPQNLERFFDRHPGAAVVGCRLLDSDGKPLVSARRFYDLLSLIGRRLAPGAGPVRRFEMLDAGSEGPRLVEWVAGNGMAVRMSAVEAIGRFDERFFLYFEDVDFCARAWLAGFEVWYLPDARIYHEETRASARSIRALAHHIASLVRFQAKWRGFGRLEFLPDTGLAPNRHSIEASEYKQPLQVRTERRTGASPSSSSRTRIRVVIEARALVGHLSGVGRSLEAVIMEMARHDDVELLLLATSLRNSRQIHRYRMYARTRAVPVPARLLDASWKQGRGIPVEFLAGRCDVVHGPNYVAPTAVSAARVITVHDLGFLRLPALHTPRQRMLADRLDRLLAGVDRIIAVSKFTEQELCELTSVDPSKIDVVYHGVRQLPHDGPPLDPAFPRQFVLYAGTLELRKGCDILLESYRLMKTKDPDVPPLVVAGKPGLGWKESFERAAGRGLRPGDVRVVSSPTDTMLARLYERAAVFLFPSLYEGFGMPPLEAMAHGVPTLVTGISALPEIVGDGAVIVDPPVELARYSLRHGTEEAYSKPKIELAAALADAALEILHNIRSSQKLAQAGRKRAKAFSWTRSAQLTVETYRKAIW
jgi:GT2 family glycosyltransferase/glycosyltransferase involved in cell wall biosynthesis